MLTLSPGSACDVCAEEYGPQRMPHSMSCGHVLCASCCTSIVEKTSSRLSPACPFCREPFTRDSLRIIRMDFTTSGWSTPHRVPAISTASEFNKVLFDQTTGSLLNFTNPKAGLNVRRLEERVARVAAKKCSVEEVSALYKELEEWIVAEKDERTSSLVLSAALLRAILMNHLAHSEASKAAKNAESNLKSKIDELEYANSKYESELKRQRAQYSQKSQECQQLRQDLSQLRALATTVGVSLPESQTQRSMSPTPSAPSPTPYSSSMSSSASAAAAAASPLARFNASHSHSRSLSMSSRPTTPATPTSPTRSHTPAPPRSHTPAHVPPRSHTPGPNSSSHYPSRSHTPGPLSASISTSSVSSSASAYARSQTPSIRSHTPAPPANAVPPVPRYSTPAPPSMTLRAQTPAPLVPPKPRRLSQPPPPQMYRSTSEEKADAHERWLPPSSPQAEYGYESSKYKSSTPRPPSRTSHSLTSRLRDVLSG